MSTLGQCMKPTIIDVDYARDYKSVTVFHGRVRDINHSESWSISAKSVTGKRVLSSCLKSYKAKTHTLISRRALEELEHEMRHALLYQLTEERFDSLHDELAIKLDSLRILLSKTDSKTFKVRKQ